MIGLEKIVALGRVVYMGLCVLWTDIRWLAGADLRYRNRLRLLKQEKNRLEQRMVASGTDAGQRERLQADLSLLEEDIMRVTNERQDAFKAAHAPLRTRFAADLD